MERAVPGLARAERLLSIPLGTLPALGICVFSLGILEGDGSWILADLATAIVSVVPVSGVLFAFLDQEHAFHFR